MDLTEPAMAALSAGDLAAGGNRLLAGLSQDTLAAIAPHCRRVHLDKAAILAEPGRVMPAVLFPERGIVSVIKRDTRGERTEVCVLGPESFVGAAVLLADGRSPYEMMVQVDDLDAFRMDVGAFVAAQERDEGFRRMLLGAIHTQMLQMAEGVASAAWQRFPARLARWLLMCRDRLGIDRIAVTHEALALMIGAQRTGITAALHELEGKGLIAAVRGQVMLRDIAGLRELADGTYGVPEREQARLLS